MVWGIAYVNHQMTKKLLKQWSVKSLVANVSLNWRFKMENSALDHADMEWGNVLEQENILIHTQERQLEQSGELPKTDIISGDDNSH